MRTEHDVPIRRFERLSRMRDFRIDRGEPDPRGWSVVNGDGRPVGDVEDLIVDVDRMTATHLYVALDARSFDFSGGDPHVLVPVERARAAGKRLVVEGISAGWVTELCEARERHQYEFWDRWWSAHDPISAHRRLRIERAVGPDELTSASDEIQPRDVVPDLDEPTIVGRRIVPDDDPLREEVVRNRAADEPAQRR